MAELGLIAAVVQVADVGIRLGEKLYTFGQTVASADQSIVFISKDISHTCSILNTLRHSLEKDHEGHSYSPSAIKTAETIVKECLEIFQEMDGALLKKITRMGLDGGSSRATVVAIERLTWPFSKPKISLLWSHLDKLKSSLQLMLNVFIYDRLLVERTDEPSVVNEQQITIQNLIRTTIDQSRKYESLKAATDGNKCLDDSNNGSVSATRGLNAALIPTEVPDTKTGNVLQVPEEDFALSPVEDYCILIQRLITEVEDKRYVIGHDMSHRIRDGVIHIHKRETRLLRETYGHKELRDRMPENCWRLAEMAARGTEEAEQSQSSFGAIFGQYDDRVSKRLDASTSQWSSLSGSRDSLGIFKESLKNDHRTTMDRARAATFYAPIQMFIDCRDDPWSPCRIAFEVPIDQEPGVAEEKGWLQSWTYYGSKIGIQKILPSNPLNHLISYTRNELMPQLPFLRSGTLMLVTDKSHILKVSASSGDLPALTVSTDSETFVSAQSEISEKDRFAFESLHISLPEGEKQEPLVVLGDQEYSEPAEFW